MQLGGPPRGVALAAESVRGSLAAFIFSRLVSIRFVSPVRSAAIYFMWPASIEQTGSVATQGA